MVGRRGRVFSSKKRPIWPELCHCPAADKGSGAPAERSESGLGGCPALMQPCLVLASQPVAIIMSSDFQWSQGKAL